MKSSPHSYRPDRKRLEHLREHGLLMDHHTIPPSGCDWCSEEEWKAICDMALKQCDGPNSAIEEDAARYRWLRDQCVPSRRIEIAEYADRPDLLDHHIDKGRCGL